MDKEQLIAVLAMIYDAAQWEVERVTAKCQANNLHAEWLKRCKYDIDVSMRSKMADAAMMFIEWERAKK